MERPVPRVLIGSMAVVLVVLTTLVILVPEALVDLVDQPLQSRLVEQHSTTLDSLMVGMTMLGDFPLTTTLMLGIVVVLLVARRYWLAMHATAVFISVKLAVAVVKTLVDRGRPLDLYVGGDVYSYPSGHTASAATLLGVCTVLILAPRLRSKRPGRARRLVTIGMLSALALMVAVSRVYLQAHWPSDVVASMALAICLAAAFEWQVRASLPLPRWVPGVVGVGLVVGYSTYLLLRFNVEIARYAAFG